MSTIEATVEVTSIKETIEYARKLAWRLNMSGEQVQEITGKLSAAKTLDEALDVLYVYFSEYLTIKRH